MSKMVVAPFVALCPSLGVIGFYKELCLNSNFIVKKNSLKMVKKRPNSVDKK